MAYAGTLVFLVLALGAFLYWRGRLASTRWFLWLGVAGDPAPVRRGARRAGCSRRSAGSRGSCGAC